MTRKTRIILFISLLILFLIAAPATVFYSLGWRFDQQTKKFFQPGILYFKVWPKSAEIYLNGKLKEKTDFFFGSALIENLVPQKYDVEIRKKGFHIWKKSLEIKKGKVCEGKNIILIPESPKFVSLAKGVKKFFFSPDEKKIILKEEVNSENPYWALKLFELEKNIKSHLIEERDISKEDVQLVDLNFSPDSKKALLKLGVKEGLEFYILELDKAPPALTPIDFLPLNIQGVYFHPKNPEKLFVLPELTSTSAEANEKEETSSPPEGIFLKGLTDLEGLSEVDLLSKTISPPLLKNVIALSFFDDTIYYLDVSGFLSKIDFSFNRQEKMNIIPFSLKQETGYKITASPSQTLLEENDTLYILNKDEKVFEKLSDSIRGFKFSPDFKKIVYFNNYEIWVLFLEKVFGQPQKEPGDQLFLTRFSEKIDDVFWYTNHYLVLNAKEKIRTSSLRSKIKIAEIDDRDGINIFDLVEFKNPEIFWSQINKKLYVLTEENLFVSEKLTP